MERDPGIPRRVAVLGAGRIGSALVARLTGAGYTVSVFDPRDEVRDGVVRSGAEWHRSPRAAIRDAQVVLTALPGSEELEALMVGGDDGLVFAIGADRTWIDVTSASSLTAQRLAAIAERCHVRYVEAPLGGGPEAARSGTLALYVGGDAAVCAELRPLLATIAHPADVHYVGAAGSGYVTKLLVNLLWFGYAALHGEALLLGQAAGVRPEALQRIFAEGPAASTFNEHYIPRLLAGDYAGGFGLDRMVEELSSLIELATKQHSPFEVSTAVTTLYERALRRFGPIEGELLAVAELEAQAGRQLRAEASESGLTQPRMSRDEG